MKTSSPRSVVASRGLRRSAAWSLAALSCVLGMAAQAETLHLAPGTWTQQRQTWVNGKPLPVRDGGTSCVRAGDPGIDLDQALQHSFQSSGPWSCQSSNTVIGGGQLHSEFACSTPGGGHQKGTAQGSYGAEQYRLDLQSKGNAVTSSGEAVPGPDVALRLVFTGKHQTGGC
jgi:hypothetical protein